MTESRGIVYIATGRKFVAEALLSARSAKKQMPDLPICLFTDLQEMVVAPPAEVDSVQLLTEVSHSCRDKMKPLLDSPYEKTLFLDTDTWLCAPVEDLFRLLDRFDIALAQAPDRYQYPLPELPACFPELNSGVIAFRQNNQVKALLHRWEATFLQMLAQNADSYRDQHSLRDALYRSDVQLFILPQEYNFRTICPNFAGKHCQVKILHGRHADLERVAARLNRTEQARVFLSSPYRIFSQELGTYESLAEATLNSVFQSLPAGLRNWLTKLRHRQNS
ncbi:hypothetical protein [Candidatus Electronema sp. PJ]|uniref:hypothetical protein n=1 Tax=Candidatus Electronema sp. PJ TaxID=3401572 RepID=UPI003AA9D925